MSAPYDQNMKAAQVHRFRDYVTLYMRNGAGDSMTVYLTSQQAWDIMNALKDCAQDVEFRKFTDSHFKTREFLE